MDLMQGHLVLAGQSHWKGLENKDTVGLIGSSDALRALLMIIALNHLWLSGGLLV